MPGFFLGLMVILLGGVLMYFNKRCEKNFGRIEWADRNLGGTYMAYVLFGFGIVVIGILMMFGIGEGFGI